MTITEIATELKTLKSVLIFSHNRPDGDTLGSATALRLALQKLGVRADIVCFYDIPDKLKYLSGVEFITKKPCLDFKYSAHVSVDCSTEGMFLDLFSYYEKSPLTINIDHHVSNTRYAKLNYVENTASCCEIIYTLIVALGVEIDKDIAECLLTGIVTDTGAFCHSNVTDNTLFVASMLKKAGADLHKIIKLNFKNQTKQRSDLYASVISKMRYRLDGKVGILVITKSDIEKAGAVDNMTEGFIDYPLTIDTVEVAISLLETGKNRFKISLRSKGKVNVNEIASLYGGGGHILASGAVLNGYLEDIIDKLCFNVEQRL